MSKRVPSLVIDDILRCIDHVSDYTKDLAFPDFSKNFMVIEACLYNIQIIGEAVAQLPEDVKENNSQIPWIVIKKTRNRLIHQYFGTDLPIVWDIITNNLPALRGQLEAIKVDLHNQGR